MKLIAGSGRSGTTWVLDSLAAANGLRPIFEPLHPAVSAIGARYAYRALSADEDHHELQRFLVEACRGHLHPMWIRYRGRPDLLLPPLHTLASLGSARNLYHEWRYFLRDLPGLVAGAASRAPIVKCIRANLMLGWLARRFDCRIVLIVRHPGAVVESQLRLSNKVWDPEPVLRRYRTDARLDEMTQGRYRRLLNRSLSRTEALAANWIVENQWPLEQADALGLTVVQYERLKSLPDLEWPRLCRALALAKAPDKVLRERPSQQSATDRSDGSQPVSRAPRWQRSLTSEQIGQIQDVLDEARFDLYSMREPDVGNATAGHGPAPAAVLQS